MWRCKGFAPASESNHLRRCVHLIWGGLTLGVRTAMAGIAGSTLVPEPLGEHHFQVVPTAGAGPWRLGYYLPGGGVERGASHALGDGNARAGPFTATPGSAGLGTMCAIGFSVFR